MFRQFVTVETFYIALLIRICITEISDWVPRDSLCDSNFAIAVCTCYMQIPGSLGLWREFRLHALSYVYSHSAICSRLPSRSDTLYKALSDVTSGLRVRRIAPPFYDEHDGNSMDSAPRIV